MTIATWPVVTRRRVVRAYKPGEASAESPFRTMRKRHLASAGVRVTRRVDGHLDGQMTFYSSLNVDSARLARHGETDAAMRVARAATVLEAGPEFRLLQRVLSGLPIQQAEQIVDGVVPDDAPAVLTVTLKAVARLTEQLRTSELALAVLAQVITGRVSEVHKEYVLLIQSKGLATIIPRWMAVGAKRDSVDALLALVMDRLDDGSAFMNAAPAIAIDEDAGIERFSPFNRGDARMLEITKSDERLLAGEPQPLQILVPVLIDA